MVQASLTIVTYNRKNIFIIQATDFDWGYADSDAITPKKGLWCRPQSEDYGVGVTWSCCRYLFIISATSTWVAEKLGFNRYRRDRPIPVSKTDSLGKIYNQLRKIDSITKCLITIAIEFVLIFKVPFPYYGHKHNKGLVDTIRSGFWIIYLLSLTWPF
jgi:hypothetical protein